MYPNSLARRQLDALNQITDATALLSERHGITPPATVQQRDPSIAMMMRFEAIATFLQELAMQPKGADRDELLAEVLGLEGLTKTSGDVIRKHYGIEEPDGDSE